MQLREPQLQLSPKASSTAQIKIPDRSSGHSSFLAQLKNFEPMHAVAAIAAILG
jgi:hypothetical protein